MLRRKISFCCQRKNEILIRVHEDMRRVNAGSAAELRSMCLCEYNIIVQLKSVCLLFSARLHVALALHLSRCCNWMFTSLSEKIYIRQFSCITSRWQHPFSQVVVTLLE